MLLTIFFVDSFMVGQHLEQRDQSKQGVRQLLVV
jgi:hypothetical protein